MNSVWQSNHCDHKFTTTPTTDVSPVIIVRSLHIAVAMPQSCRPQRFGPLNVHSQKPLLQCNIAAHHIAFLLLLPSRNLAEI